MALVVDVPGVNTAVEHLQELADRMQHDFGFSDDDVNNIDQVIEALRQLEAERKAAHARLEEETIKASIQRHCLQFLPQQISQEITDAVESAKKSNAEAIVALKKQLEDINNNIVYLEGYQKKLDEENAHLHPERELIRQQHEEIISQLNQRMAEKASMQIHLNETRDRVRQTNQEIVDLEDGILQLKEDLIQERGEARKEKRQLKKAVAHTTEKTKEQKKINVDKKKDLDILHDKLMDSEGKLDSLRKSLRRFETNKAKLEGQERALTAQLQKQLKQNDELKKKGNAIIAEEMKLSKDFIEKENNLTNRIKRLDEEIQNQTLRFDELDTDRTELSYGIDFPITVEKIRAKVEELLQIREEDAERVSELNAKLQNEKRNLSSKAEEVGDLQGQNTKMTEEIELIGETHKAVMAQLQKQIEDYRAQLAFERKERLEVQDRKNSTSKELEDFKLDNQRFMQEMNTTITQGKQDHISLSNEMGTLHELEEEDSSDWTSEDEELGAQLQRDLRDDDKEIQDLETILEEEQQKYQQTFTKRQNEVDKMEREINDMEFQIAEKKQKVEDMGPGFAALEKAFEERTDAYEKQKKDIVELKGKKNQLEEKIRQAKDKKERMADPQEKLRKELKQKRHEVIFQLKHQGEETKEIESQIYGTGCKVKTILDENQRIEDGIKAFNKEIDDLHYQMEYNEKLKVKLLLELANTKDILGQSWDEDTELQQRYSERDQLVVDGLGELLDRTVKREETISAVTGRLEVELQFLSDFLDNLASRRPKDSYLSQCRTPIPATPDSREGRRPLSQVSSISRASSSRSLPPLEMADTHSPSRPTTSKSARSGRNVVISEEVTEIAHGGNERTKTITKSM
ncbi:coiled-coil domain-containing protein 175-like isoform X2 [Mya arenaria]|uniref:coiled-coil domain-containing protein 175-like isoform X2 n=1 Tax=Mya arenaria TaxID=6604 RepID=UPI0022E211C0|nr:coiled-coil domain-containing protein 175-like isoform X2 [Mya arenaria]